MDAIELYEQKLHQTINSILGINGVLEKNHYSNTQTDILQAWLIGFYINNYEKYLLKHLLPFDRKNLQITTYLVTEGMNNISVEMLSQYKSLFNKYSALLSFLPENKQPTIYSPIQPKQGLSISTLFAHLEIGHFLILSKIMSSIKTAFYEIIIIEQKWSVQDFQHFINHFYFEQNGPEFDLEEAIENMAQDLYQKVI